MREILTMDCFMEMDLYTIHQDLELKEFGKKENAYNKITYSATVSDFSKIIGSTVRCPTEGIIPVNDIPIKILIYLKHLNIFIYTYSSIIFTVIYR